MSGHKLPFRRRRRRGTTVVEALIALALLGAASGVFAQLYLLAGRQQRSADARSAASLTLGNWMERCAQVPLEELDEERLTALASIELLKPLLPDVEPVASVTAEDGPPAGKRVTLSLRWPAADGVSHEEIQLTAWRFGSETAEEETP